MGEKTTSLTPLFRSSNAHWGPKSWVKTKLQVVLPHQKSLSSGLESATDAAHISPLESAKVPSVPSLEKRWNWRKAAIRQITNPCAPVAGRDLHKLDIFHTLFTGHFLKAPSSKGRAWQWSLGTATGGQPWGPGSLHGWLSSLTASSSTAWPLLRSTFKRPATKKQVFPTEKLRNTLSLKSAVSALLYLPFSCLTPWGFQDKMWSHA